jgi:hypothetical protein
VSAKASGRCACGSDAHAGVALTSLPAGTVGVVCETCMDPADAAMVRAMGLRPRSTIRLCRLGEPCIVEVLAGGGDEDDGPARCDRPDCRCRIGLTRDLAARVRVTLRAGGS